MKKTILDVRTSAEFISGHVENSVNIPLQELPDRWKEISSLPQPLTICCASGMRSAQAVTYLKSLGIKCENGGGWRDVQFSTN